MLVLTTCVLPAICYLCLLIKTRVNYVSINDLCFSYWLWYVNIVYGYAYFSVGLDLWNTSPNYCLSYGTNVWLSIDLDAGIYIIRVLGFGKTLAYKNLYMFWFDKFDKISNMWWKPWYMRVGVRLSHAWLGMKPDFVAEYVFFFSLFKILIV